MKRTKRPRSTPPAALDKPLIVTVVERDDRGDRWAQALTLLLEAGGMGDE